MIKKRGIYNIKFISRNNRFAFGNLEKENLLRNKKREKYSDKRKIKK